MEICKLNKYKYRGAYFNAKKNYQVKFSTGALVGRRVMSMQNKRQTWGGGGGDTFYQ